MNESFGAEGNSWTMPDDVERHDAEVPGAWSRTRSRSRSPRWSE